MVAVFGWWGVIGGDNVATLLQETMVEWGWMKAAEKYSDDVAVGGSP